MSVAATVNTTTQQVAVTVNPTTREVAVTVSNARGAAGSNSVTSATTSDGTADLDLLNVETVTATVSDTLTANHIHGNLAGNVYAHVRAGETLTKGDPVYVSGSFGSGSTLIPIVSKAAANNAAKMPAIGMMDANLANNAIGHMVIVGTITELNTAGLTVNAELYVAAGGGLTGTPPTARAQPVARVERVNANNGAVIVKVNGLSASDATGNTLVRRTVTGGVSLGEIFLSGSIAPAASGQYDIGLDDTPVKGVYCQTMTVANAVSFGATTYTYGAGAASAHRIALGAGTTGAALFGAADAAAARTTLGFDGMIPKIPFTVDLNSDFTTASTSFVNATGLSFPVEANKIYSVVISLFVNKNDAAGMQIQITGPASPTMVFARLAYTTNSVTNATSVVQTAFSTATATFNTFNGDGYYYTPGPNLLISNGTNAGTVQLQLRAVTSGTAKIYAGSTIVVTEL